MGGLFTKPENNKGKGNARQFDGLRGTLFNYTGHTPSNEEITAGIIHDHYKYGMFQQASDIAKTAAHTLILTTVFWVIKEIGGGSEFKNSASLVNDFLLCLLLAGLAVWACKHIGGTNREEHQYPSKRL